MRLSAEQARALAHQAMFMTRADAAEAVVTSTSSALTRFADNRIHQNVAESGTHLTIRAVIGQRTGVGSTNRLDDDGLARCAAAAVEAARHAPEDPAFPGLPGAAPVSIPQRRNPATSGFDADRRAEAVRAIVEQSEARGLVAAGSVAVNDYAMAVANSRDVSVAMEADDLRCTVLSMGRRGGSGWASFLTNDAAAFTPSALGSRAAQTAEHSEDPGSLDPGMYTVVLAPEAVSDILAFLGYLGFGAKAFAEKGSFLAGAIGTRIVDERISVLDDALAPGTVGLAFDFEGQPKRRTTLIENGMAREPVTDSYYSAKLGLPNTGHALPSPNPYGPLALNLEMAAGDTTESAMIASVERGVYVTRFHYVNVEDPMKVILTGMTRDGTFLIEDGEITTPVRNQRFTQGVLEAFSHVGAVGSQRVLIGPGEGGATLVPALLLNRWEFTGQTG